MASFRLERLILFLLVFITVQARLASSHLSQAALLACQPQEGEQVFIRNITSEENNRICLYLGGQSDPRDQKSKAARSKRAAPKNLTNMRAPDPRHPGLEPHNPSLKSNRKPEYAKGFDPDNWLSINKETSEIILTKIPDRESPYLVNGAYMAKILCMTKDVPPKTATGTIALKVQDSNDNCPELTSTYQNQCSDVKVINVTAHDKDMHPFGDPFTFKLIEKKTRGKWEMLPVNGTSVSFHSKELLWPGVYELTMEISDAKGLSCKDSQKLKVEVCTCQGGSSCGLRATNQRQSSPKAGFPGLIAVIPALLLLMLIPLLLLFCECGNKSFFAEMPYDTKEHLMSYNTEGPAEEVLMFSALDHHRYVLNGNAANKDQTMVVQSSNVFGAAPQARELHTESVMFDMSEYHQDDRMMMAAQQSLYSGGGNAFHSTSFRQKSNGVNDEMALPDLFLHKYFSQKAFHEANNPPSSDTFKMYRDEDQCSLAGSLECIVDDDPDNNLEFLNNLGLKFNALAKISHPPQPIPASLKFKQTEQMVKSVETNIKSENLESTKTVQDVKSVQAVSNESHVRDVSSVSDVTETVSLNTAQTILVQEQPLYYLVEHQVPSTVILTEKPAHGMYLINDATATEGLVLHGSDLTVNSLEQQGMYVIENGSIVQGNIMLGGQAASTNLTSSGAFLASSDLARADTFVVSPNLRSSGAFLANQNLANSGIVSSTMVQEKKGKQQLNGSLQQGPGTVMLGGHVTNNNLPSSGAFLASSNTLVVSSNLGNSGAFVVNQNLANSGTLTRPSIMVPEEKSKQQLKGSLPQGQQQGQLREKML